EAVRPAGSLRIGGMCAGCMIAIEVGRRLQEQGRQIGPLILADPPPVPYAFNKRQLRVDLGTDVAERLYQESKSSFLERSAKFNEELVLDIDDPDQLHAATLAGMGTLIALANHVPKPFLGSVEMILCAVRAAGFFHPMMPWHKLLPGPRVVHVLSWPHVE